ncbi:MAG: SpoIIE family protein phosphatase [Bacteroidales bacterium]|nr:SpoIIE family protein phosphatase [Bacteroidales bacterium]
MSILDYTKKQIMRKSVWAGLLLVIVAAFTLEATGLIQYYFSQKGIKEEASRRAESQLETTRVKIIDVIDQAEAAVRNSVWITRWCLGVPDSLSVVTRRVVEDNPAVVGSTVALVPGYLPSKPLFSPYSHREMGSGKILLKSLATEEYDYPSQEWFRKPLESGEPYWSEPYIDEGGGEMLMTTYSMPIRDEKGRIAAILTADVSLDWLTDLVGGVKVYPNAFSVMLSRSGRIMVCPAETLVMRKTFQEIASESDDSTALNGLGDEMMSGRAGNIPFRYKGKTSHIFFAPVERTGWSMSIVIPYDEIYGSIRKIGFIVTLMQVLGILMLILILRAAAKNQIRYQAVSEKKERMESELQIASGIQMSMIPKTFPPFPERKDIDMSAAIVPAKEVGGDLYDFFIRDEQLFFCIGDVSGKGVPAALVMAVTRSLFRAVSARETSPGQIVSAMNASMSDMNESNMFVTFFCGTLNLSNGKLRYCNAGHNAPLLFTDRIAPLPVDANLPLGIQQDWVFHEQEQQLSYDDAIFLYTDGLTEAENTEHELFGEERMRSVLHTRRPAQEQMNAERQAVSEFVGDAPQSDDLTMLFIHYLNGGPGQEPEEKRHHLQLYNDLSEIERLHAFVEEIAGEHGIDPSIAMQLDLALEEAATNVILYAYPKGKGGTLNIDVCGSSGKLSFLLTDTGEPFDPTAAPEADTSLPAEERPIGGLGIHLVRTIMDTVEYRHEDGRNMLTLTKKID